MEQHSVQVGTQFYREGIYQRLVDLQSQELPIDIREIQQGKRWLIQCEFTVPSTERKANRRRLKKIHAYYLANALAETILQNWEKDHIRLLLKKKYKLRTKELDLVLDKTLIYLNEGSKNNQVIRKASLINLILNCLDTHPIFDIEGFLRFRAREYKDKVDRAVSYIVDEHMIEKEYTDFIEMLKHFVDSQMPRLDTLHVGINKQGRFNLYDEEGKKITQQYMDELSFGGSNDLTYEDLLVSALIAVAPRQIVLHISFEGYRDTLQTIVKVFDGRVSYCHEGCVICRKI